jgi:hypothetical protein
MKDLVKYLEIVSEDKVKFVFGNKLYVFTKIELEKHLVSKWQITITNVNSTYLDNKAEEKYKRKDNQRYFIVETFLKDFNSWALINAESGGTLLTIYNIRDIVTGYVTISAFNYTP